MQPPPISPTDARFWVRPYEFEGDGSTGAAADVASIEVAGKRRTFWLKTLENRLFFREVGRDEMWNFGALALLDCANLKTAFSRALKEKEFGRVILLGGCLPRPCFFLAAQNGLLWCGVPKHQLSAVARWKPPVEKRDCPFLDWEREDLLVLDRSDLLIPKSRIFRKFRNRLVQTSAPEIQLHWAPGSCEDMGDILQAFVAFFWKRFAFESQYSFQVGWACSSAWQMQKMRFQFVRHFEFRPNAGYSCDLSQDLEWRARLIVEQFCLVGQRLRHQRLWPYTISGRVSQPTHHETLEAHLFLRDWINRKLPSAQAKEWLNFT